MKLHGPTIRIRRLELGMTQKDVKLATGIDDSNLSKIERGINLGVTPKRAEALARCLEVTIAEISPEFAELKRKAES